MHDNEEGMILWDEKVIDVSCITRNTMVNSNWSLSRRSNEFF